jgi:hypothetical protein
MQALRNTLRAMTGSVEGQQCVDELLAQLSKPQAAPQSGDFDASAVERGDIDRTIAATLQMLAGMPGYCVSGYNVCMRRCAGKGLCCR